MAGSSAAQAKLKVFISYSRRDLAFVERLVDALERRDIHVLIDRRDLPLVVEFQKELQGFIRAADTIIYVVSPASIASPWCGWEVEQVKALSKRLAPIVCENVPDASVPEDIRKINYVFFTGAYGSGAEFERQADALADALKTDVDWLRRHTRFGERALLWESRGKAKSLLLGENELREAEDWAARQPLNAPPLSQIQREFISASRHGARRRRNVVTGSLAAGLIITAGLGGLAWRQAQIAAKERDAAYGNLGVAIETADSLVTEVAAMLQNLKGVKQEYLRAILDASEIRFNRIAKLAPEDVRLLERKVNLLNVLSAAYSRLGSVSDGLKRADDGIALANTLLARDAKNLTLAALLIDGLIEQGDRRKQVADIAGEKASYEEALSRARALVAAKGVRSARSKLALSLSRYGALIAERGQPREGVALLEEAVALERQMASGGPDTRGQKNALSGALMILGNVQKNHLNDWQAAGAAFDEALVIARELSAAMPEIKPARWFLRLALSNVAQAKRNTGDRKGALETYEESLAIVTRIAEDDPKDQLMQKELASALGDVAIVTFEMGNAEAAKDKIARSTAILRKVAESAPSERLELMGSLVASGRIRAAAKDAPGAIADFDEGVAIMRELAAADRDNSAQQDRLAFALESRSMAKINGADRSGGLADAREALSIRREVARAAPKNASSQLAYLKQIGWVAHWLRQGPEAETEVRPYCEELVSASRALLAADPDSLEWPQYLAAGLNQLADVSEGEVKRAHLGEALQIAERLQTAEALTKHSQRWVADLRQKILAKQQAIASESATP